jgi:hypothetical protein
MFFDNCPISLEILNWFSTIFNMCRKWKLEKASNPNTSPFMEWVKNVVHGQPMDLSNPEDINMVLLCSKLGQTTIRYIWMKAYWNHFEVEDSRSYSLQTFDSGVAYVFDMPTTNVFEIFVNYVGILKNIFKLDYGLMHNHVIIFRCEWIK